MQHKEERDMSTFIKVQKTISPWNFRAITNLSKTIMLWSERYQQRKQLARMSDRLLKDIGISRSDSWHEAQKPFWKP